LLELAVSPQHGEVFAAKLCREKTEIQARQETVDRAHADADARQDGARSRTSLAQRIFHAGRQAGK
jgi:hypothetical protein